MHPAWQGYWISELAFLERLEHTDLTLWHCLPKESRIHILRDRIQAWEGALGTLQEQLILHMKKHLKSTIEIDICLCSIT